MEYYPSLETNSCKSARENSAPSFVARRVITAFNTACQYSTFWDRYVYTFPICFSKVTLILYSHVLAVSNLKFSKQYEERIYHPCVLLATPIPFCLVWLILYLVKSTNKPLSCHFPPLTAKYCPQHPLQTLSDSFF
jgi:hypothetical protein